MKRKKLIAILMSAVIALALSSCGGGGSGGSAEVDDNPYNLDMTSTEVQPMSEERASAEVLRETRDDYFQGLNYFVGTDLVDLTYDDVVEHIGVDPSSYQYDDQRKCDLYTWYADAEEDSACLTVWFMDGKLDASGSYNIG